MRYINKPMKIFFNINIKSKTTETLINPAQLSQVRMTLKLFNTLSRKKEIFKPIKKGFVGMYSCGPTVYDFAHIGNFRAYVCVDILKRYLKYKGYKIKHVMNLTDVDDKTIRGSIKENISLKDYTEKYSECFFEDIGVLNIDKADIYPKATGHVKEMVEIIKSLLKKEIAYKSEDGSVYYDISKFGDYGKLSKTEISSLKEGARISQDQYEKDEANDFALWKFYTEDDGNVFWETDIGKGRPGWHIECSAMSMKHLGNHFDIHAGGVDLVFPHHENEIAQSEAATNEKFANYWFHNEHLLVNGKKMSKSMGNFFTLRDLIKKEYNPRAIRYLLLSAHYRQQLNFTEDALKAAENTIQRLDDFILKLKSVKLAGEESVRIKTLIKKTTKMFDSSMDDDLNISEALSSIFEFMKEINIMLDKNSVTEKDTLSIIGFMKEINSVLGVIDFDIGKENLLPEIVEMIEEREKARHENNFELADKIRKQILEKGIILEDTKEGTRWKKAA